MKSEITFILGASDKVDRYSYQARSMLHEYGFRTALISPRVKLVEGEIVHPDIKSAVLAVGNPDTITMYVGASVSSQMKNEILSSQPRRVIFNPGSENADLAAALRNSGVAVLEACTLVMLRTGQF